mgnify:CR=1 FL=1
MLLLLLIVGKGYYGKRLSSDVLKTQKELDELTSEITLKLDEIESVELTNIENGIQTSALFALLYTLKKRKADIKIPFYDEFKMVENMGKVLFVKCLK